MCGIIGYVGKKEAMPVLLDGLRRLEYRGYDSAGIAVLNQKKHTIKSIKSVGKIDKLEEKIGGSKFFGNTGIAHTRWATHGKPSAKNSHPHSDCTGSLQIVHNGIIENYQELKEKLIKEGHKFKSETDSEVIAHLIEEYYQKDLATAIKKVLKLIKGAYGIVVIHKDLPEKIIAARKGSPLIIGVGKHETIVASDASAIVRYTKQVIYLDDGELIEISPNNFEIFNVNNKKITKKVKEIDWEIDKIEKGGMLILCLKKYLRRQTSSQILSVAG
jgi:glucosamine--fructose-6-phosphate aminotransferase (isomerizing)